MKPLEQSLPRFPEKTVAVADSDDALLHARGRAHPRHPVFLDFDPDVALGYLDPCFDSNPPARDLSQPALAYPLSLQIVPDGNLQRLEDKSACDSDAPVDPRFPSRQWQ